MVSKRLRLGILFCFLVGPSFVMPASEVSQPEKVPKPTTKSPQESAVKDLLKSVEKHFDKLSARMTSLENTVSSIQFFSIRQFNQISGSLQATNGDLGAIRKQVSHIETDGRSQKITLSLLGRDMTELKKSSSDMLSELESSVVYISESLEKQGDQIRTMLGDIVVTAARETSVQVSKQIDEMSSKNNYLQSDPVNCTVDMSEFSKQMDQRFQEFKKQAQINFVKLINATKIDVKKIVCTQNVEFITTEKKLCDCKNGVDKMNHGHDLLEPLLPEIRADNITMFDNITNQTNIFYNITSNDSRSDNVSRFINSTGSITKNITAIETFTDEISKSKTTAVPVSPDEGKDLQDEQDEKIMNTLYNMTTSVLQAVSYFRHTGQLLEKIMSNTDSLVVVQNDFNRRLMTLEMSGTSQTHYGNNNTSNLVPDNENMQELNNGVHGGQPAIQGCHIPNGMLDSIATVIKNGSQLLEVLTDLAHTSSVSLIKATAVLQDEVKRVEGVRTLMATMFLYRGNQEESDPIVKLNNMTQRIFKLVEAVASNNGWLPLILHNVQHLESLGNRSLQIAKQNQDILSQLQQNIAAQGSDKESVQDKEDPTVSNRIPHTLGQEDGWSLNKMNTSLKLDTSLNRESLKVIYSMGVEFRRIMPILFKLLEEHDPLVTLVDGDLDRGRVEIYNEGQWGTLCHANFTHFEADLICRHLGFNGGISAGAGHFGPGSGVTWVFNASCLGANLCDVVTQSKLSEQCSHNQDSAVICDHMLRIVPSNETTKETAGRLEIYNKSTWLPVCGDGWDESSARVACEQMGFSDGHPQDIPVWSENKTSTWLGKTKCTGLEKRLDACPSEGWVESCTGQTPAGVQCL